MHQLTPIKFLVLLFPLLIVASCAPEESSQKEPQEAIQMEPPREIDTYRLTSNSSRKNFFLQKEADTLTLFGWKRLHDYDTVYFRSLAVVESFPTIPFQANFKEFALTQTPNTLENLAQFTTDTSLHHETYWMETQMTAESLSGDTILFKGHTNSDFMIHRYEFEKVDQRRNSL